MTTSAEAFLDRFLEWALAREDVVGVALVGSHARGKARPDSDLDIMTIVRAPSELVADPSWCDAFGEVTRRTVEQWGAVTSVRVHYEGGLEVEFGLTTPVWAATDPVDPGTARVVREGFRILLDRGGSLARLGQPPRRQQRRP